jgi:ATP-dependent Lon protease
MATSLVSALTRIPVHNELAMTGEITLRGQVLPIGGLKEKVLAAHRGGIKVVLIPRDNEKDIEEIPSLILKTVELVLVSHMDEVLKRALALSDPGSLWKKSETLAPSKSEPPSFEDKDEEVPSAEILPQ